MLCHTIVIWHLSPNFYMHFVYIILLSLLSLMSHTWERDYKGCSKASWSTWNLKGMCLFQLLLLKNSDILCVRVFHYKMHRELKYIDLYYCCNILGINRILLELHATTSVVVVTEEHCHRKQLVYSCPIVFSRASWFHSIMCVATWSILRLESTCMDSTL